MQLELVVGSSSLPRSDRNGPFSGQIVYYRIMASFYSNPKSQLPVSPSPVHSPTSAERRASLAELAFIAAELAADVAVFAAGNNDTADYYCIAVFLCNVNRISK